MHLQTVVNICNGVSTTGLIEIKRLVIPGIFMENKKKMMEQEYELGLYSAMVG